MYTEYYFDVDYDAESESNTRAKTIPKQHEWSNAERDRDLAGVYRVILVSAIMIVDLKFGLNPFTSLATLAALPLLAHLRD